MTLLSAPSRSAASARRVAIALGAADIVLTVAGALAAAALFPGASSWATRLAVVLLLAAAVTALLAATNGWRTAGFTAAVREPRLLWLPAVIALVPLAGGVHLPGAGLLAVLVVGYAATGFVEEALFRGAILGTLRPAGAWPAVLISSALFAVAHLPNMLFGQAPAITVAQAVGTFCFGVGYAALRLRTGSVWPLMVLHFLTDLLLRVDALPAWAHWTAMVGGDTVLLIYGLLLMRGTARAAADA
ncbi:CPBP family intramembrane glutamic endopeptidase [Dactylosporangium salmoneum]|uniref:CAAX prenyl protease 2/Lysostaphin resistance protein A-like domain-containing protein n=1 Tax=Dactylosporangium salmoneum TaxID=53361 RepID=A0ABP5V1P5_9ACTN